MFKCVLKWKTDVKEKAQKLTKQYIKIYSSNINNNYINHNCRNNDESMLIDQISKNKNIFYDMNNYIHDPIVAHNEFKNRIVWSDKEINTFIESYSKNPKQFKKIADSLQTKSVKDVIEFYYNNRYNLNLKKYEIMGKKKGKLNHY